MSRLHRTPARSRTAVAAPRAEFAERVRTNAFRLLGLSARATCGDVERAAERAAVRRSLGHLPGGVGVAPVHTDPATVRDAAARLTAPAERCVERLLWFLALPCAEERLIDRPAPDPFELDHDTALVALLTRLRSDPDLRAHDEWVRALRRWQEDVAQLAEVLRALETEGGYADVATDDDIARAITVAGDLPLRAIAGIGRTASLTGDWERVGAAAYLIGASALDEERADRLHRLLLHPLATITEKRCAAAARAAQETSTPLHRGPGWAQRRTRLLRRWYRGRVAPDVVRLRHVARASRTRIARIDAVERHAAAARSALRSAADGPAGSSRRRRRAG